MAGLALIDVAVRGIQVPATVVIDGGRVTRIGPASEVAVAEGLGRLGGHGLSVVPGYLDHHTHGALGFDYFGAAPDEIGQVLAWLPSTGVTGILMTTTTAPEADLAATLRNLADVVEHPPPGARPLGIHLEGPWISLEQRGAQLADPIRPGTIAEFDRLQEAARGHIVMVSLAPEIPGAVELVTHLVHRGVIAAAIHTNATYDEVRAAADAGLSHVSHCFNAMRGLHHREPGVVGAALALDSLSVDAILDGYHVHPVVAQILYSAKGPATFGLITDSMQATGLGDGTYVRPGGRVVTVLDGQARLPSGALAGSVLTVDRAVRHAAMWFNLPIAEAASLARQCSATLLGQDSELSVGAPADLCGLDAHGEVVWTMVAGEIRYERNPEVSR